MAWQLELFDETFRELDCTPSLAERIEDATGLRWPGVGITLARGEVKCIRRTAGVLLSDKLGMTVDEAFVKIDTMKVAELLATYSEYEDDLPTVLEDGFPQSADDLSTPY